MELGHSEQTEPDADLTTKPCPDRGLEEDEGSDHQGAEHQPDEHLEEELGAGEHQGAEAGQGPGEAGDYQGAEEGAGHDSREGVMVIAVQVPAVMEDVVHSLEVEALLDLGVGAEDHVGRGGQVEDNIENSVQPLDGVTV